MLELLQYLAIVGPIHLRAVTGGAFDMDAWRTLWSTEEARAETMGLEQVKDAIGKHPTLFAERLGTCPDTSLRDELEMFGSKASRGSWITSLVLCHYVPIGCNCSCI
jgi:hypothetical protein